MTSLVWLDSVLRHQSDGRRVVIKTCHLIRPCVSAVRGHVCERVRAGDNSAALAAAATDGKETAIMIMAAEKKSYSSPSSLQADYRISLPHSHPLHPPPRAPLPANPRRVILS